MEVNNNYGMSFFEKPISNKHPRWTVTPFWVYQYVRSGAARRQTMELRALSDEGEQRRYKTSNFDYVMPAGVFAYGSDAGLVRPSGLLCMDLDYLGARVDELWTALLDDSQFTTVLMFHSPRGQGIKWWIAIDTERCDYRTWFQAVRNYLMATYGLSEKQVDPAVGHVSAGCFLSYDPDAYLRTELIEYF